MRAPNSAWISTVTPIKTKSLFSSNSNQKASQMLCSNRPWASPGPPSSGTKESCAIWRRERLLPTKNLNASTNPNGRNPISSLSSPSVGNTPPTAKTKSPSSSSATMASHSANPPWDAS